MSGYKSANDRIVKNTTVLYVRMLISMLVSLYTSRVVLKALGAEDYGIFNVIGGFVTLLAFVNGSMVSATRRYLTMAIADGDLEKRRLTFSASFYIHVGIALVVTILAFSVGYYFLEYKMTIPDGRKVIAYWVFFSSLLSVLALCITVPHNALVVAYEEMGIFAFLSLGEVFLKLLIAFFILQTSLDRLFIYALLMGGVSIFVRVLYVLYCHWKFGDVCYRFPRDMDLIKKMVFFASWNMFSAVSISVYQQGVNLLLNMFFGPVVNAARGIAVQVQGAVKMLAVNFQQAVSPQITKSYAVTDYLRLQQLIFFSVKSSYFLMFVMAFPMIIEIDSILKFWLGDVPEYTGVFVRLSLGIVLLEMMTEPFTTAVLAKGVIRKYQFMTGIIQLTIIPMSYVFLKAGASPESVYMVNLVIMIVLCCYKISMAMLLLNMRRMFFIKSVMLPIILVTLLSVGVYGSIRLLVGEINAVLDAVLCVVISSLSIYLFGLKKAEKAYILNYILKR